MTPVCWIKAKRGLDYIVVTYLLDGHLHKDGWLGFRAICGSFKQKAINFCTQSDRIKFKWEAANRHIYLHEWRI